MIAFTIIFITTLRKNMLFGVGIGTNDLATFGAFYDQALATIRMTCIVSDEQERSYADKDGKVTFFLILAFNKQQVTFGNGTQVIFLLQILSQ